MSRKFALTSSGPLSGKSTLAKRLEREYDFIRVDHSLSVISSFVLWANQQGDGSGLSLPITAKDVYKNKEYYRPMLQEHGYRVGFNDPKYMKGWILFTLSPWLAHQDRDVVFEPFRGEAQAQALRELGFTLVQLCISEEERAYRAMQNGKSYASILTAMAAHPELELGIKSPDITLNGELDVGVLARSLIFRPEHLRDERIG